MIYYQSPFKLTVHSKIHCIIQIIKNYTFPVIYNFAQFCFFIFDIFNKMQDFFQEGVDAFVFYEKDVSNQVSRHQKNLQKIDKLKNRINDPQIKRQRHTIRRTQQKNKLQKQLQGMTQQQARVYLDEKKQCKQLAKQKMQAALKDPQGQQVFIDMVFEDRMNGKQNKSLAIQVQLIMKSIRHLNNPPGVHLCSVGGMVQQQLQKMTYHYWTLQSHKEDIVQIGHRLNKKLVYLSPDAPKPLQSVQSDTAYVIGGLVDRTVIKYASYDRAQKLKIQSRHLPIRQFMKNRSCLNLDHVVVIMSKFKQCKDWKQAFEYGAPKRWRKAQGQEGLKRIGTQSQEEQQSHNCSQIKPQQQSIQQTNK